ncbi:MAG TPA: LLM class flavin-dependent oxidoreductase [Acidimicrobiales bacterium]|nr:LLM class flavin-dependent oxidoreductase [Acidimicrobiales bacterium]
MTDAGTEPAPLIFALQAQPESGPEWSEMARAAEAAGFHDLVVADHPGTTAAPFVALAAAAGLTRHVRLGTAVANLGRWHPYDLACEVATLDLVSGTRALLGIGAGHTPAEWLMVGRPYPDPSARVTRMIEVAETCLSLLSGERVTFEGSDFRLEEASVDWPPERRRVPLLVGGNNRRLLRWAGANADVVEVTGLGRTLADGHHHAVRWSPEQLDASVEGVREAARGRVHPPILGTLVHVVEVTEDRESALEILHRRLAVGMPPESVPTLEDLGSCPYVLIGSRAEMAEQLAGHQRRWGFRRYTLRPPLAPLRSVMGAPGAD